MIVLLVEFVIIEMYIFIEDSGFFWVVFYCLFESLFKIIGLFVVVNIVDFKFFYYLGQVLYYQWSFFKYYVLGNYISCIVCYVIFRW